MELSTAHCRNHARFEQDCAICRQARANVEPYPVKKIPPVQRSFGQTGNITTATFSDSGESSWIDTGDPQVDLPFNLSKAALGFLMRLIWPFWRLK